MFKKVLGVLLVVSLMIACAKKQENTEQTAAEAVITVSVDSLLVAPQNYLDKQIEVSGLVSHVCRHTGKKLFIAGQTPEQLIKVVTGENIPQFAVELEGSQVKVQGKFALETAVAAPDSAVAKTKGIDCATDSLAVYSIVCSSIQKVE
ncbi:MAG TPA: hypothetical protein PLP19_05390 [bacterium]|nr:hypothetical protein [bacterium]HPN42905.1 hypothetical protein [bacterium]